MQYLREIPQTSNKNYVSGWQALNCPDEYGVVADWHPRYFWYSNKKSDPIPLFNTSNVLGFYGIEKRNIIYTRDKVYIANFVRSIADLILLNDDIDILRNCVNDFLSDSEQEIKLYELLLKINEVKNIEWFLKSEFTKYYYNKTFV